MATPIIDRFAKADWDIPVVVSGLPAGVNAVGATFLLKRNKQELDSAALISKVITTSLGATGQITQSGTTATLRFLVPELETDHPPGSFFYYRVYMTTEDSQAAPFTEVVADGNFLVN